MLKKIGVYGVILVGLAVMYSPVPIQLIFWNTSASLPVGIYLRIPNFSLRNGDTVLFNLPEDVFKLCAERGYLPEGRPIYSLKRILTSGQPYGIHPDSLFIGSHYVGPIFNTDSAGKPLPHRPIGAFCVPKGKIFTYTPHPKSFDSRYYGPVNESSVIARVVPLITW